MKKPFFNRILASTLILCPVISTASVVADKNIKVGIQRSFVNLDFSQPDITQYSDRGIKGGTPKASSNVFLSQDEIPGWLTTHPYKELSYGKWNPAGRLIEIWRGAGAASLPNGANDQYAELNAQEKSALYQQVCAFGGESFEWSLDHAARKATDEKLQFSIGKITDDKPEVLEVINTSIASHTQKARWTTHGGTHTIDKSKVSTSGDVVAFIFSSENEGSEGNLLDNIVLKLKPAVEFSTADGEFVENITDIQPIPFKIVGQVSEDAMPVLRFKVEYSDDIPTEKRAIYGKDYEIYTVFKGQYRLLTVNDNGLITDDKKENITFNYQPDYNANLNYAQGVEINGLAIKLKDNLKADGDKFLPFSLDLPKADDIDTINALNEPPEAVVSSVSSLAKCSTVDAIQKFQIKIIDNDIDLAVNKKLIEEFPTAGSKVSYSIDLENKTEKDAHDVILKDSLFAGLTHDVDLKVTCNEVDHVGNQATCPTLPSDAAKQLFSQNGLNIGKISGKSKLKFVVSGLKVDLNSKADSNASHYAEYSASKDYSGRIANYVEVSTTSSDINLDNNKSTAENWVASLSDLSNHVTGSLDDTGLGLFYIAEGGRTGTVPLLTKMTDNTNEVYFPLLIENKAPYRQDYKLHASKTAISTLSTGEYSGLDGSTISSYTSGLDIKFYLAEQDQCKAGLSTNVVSQVTVDANTSAQVCAQVMASKSAQSQNPIWFAIESLQTGLGDIIKNEVTYDVATLRQLILVNDQQAQVNIGGTYVFSHRLSNDGSITEDNLQLTLEPLSPNDNFSYSLFLDHNNNGVLDIDDEQVNDKTIVPSLAVGERLNLLVKVQAPTTATHGMRSQVQLLVTPRLEVNNAILEKLVNTDTIFVGLDQLVLQKMQFKQENCSNMSAEQVKLANYSLGQMSIGRKDCIIYRIEASNIGTEKLTSIVINDMYPHYSTPWLSNGTLPMTDSGDVVSKQNDKVETKIKELLPGEKKSLYFGIHLQ